MEVDQVKIEKEMKNKEQVAMQRFYNQITLNLENDKKDKEEANDTQVEISFRHRAFKFLYFSILSQLTGWRLNYCLLFIKWFNLFKIIIKFHKLKSKRETTRAKQVVLVNIQYISSQTLFSGPRVSSHVPNPVCCEQMLCPKVIDGRRLDTVYSRYFEALDPSYKPTP